MTHYNEMRKCRTKVHQLRSLLMLLLVVGSGSAMAQVQIHGSVFGGGNNAEVQIDTKVAISDGTVMKNVYGGGNKGNVIGTTEVDICAKETATPGTYEAVAESATEGHGVLIKGDVFGGGKGDDDNFFCNKAMVGVDGDGIAHPDGGTTVCIGDGTIGTATTGGNVYGGGEIGRVEKNTVVMIGFGNGTGSSTTAPHIMGNVFGAGKGVSTHGFSALVRGNSTVTIAGDAKIGKNVYGGGQIATVGRYVVVNSRPTKPASGGTCTVTIQGHAIIGQDADENIKGDVFGAGKGVLPYEGYESSETPWSMLADNTHNNYPAASSSDDKADYFAFIQTLGLASYTDVTINGNAKVKGSVYGGSENGFLQAHTSVKIQGSSKVGYDKDENPVEGSGRIYGGGRGDNSVSGYEEAGKVRGNTNVTISNGSVNGSVFGGGEMGYTIGSANVTINGGTINHDVYGGGALADTNTGKEGGTTVYVPVPGSEMPSNPKEAGLYVNKYVRTTDTKIEANQTYYADANGTPISGVINSNPSSVPYYVWSEIDYDPTTDTAPVSGKKYYTIVHPTTVNLFSGLIKGDAYGGGLGRLEDTPHSITAIEAKVYGDVTVNLGNPAEANNDAARATAFELNTTSGTIDETTYTGIASSGRIFGCNNLNGSPKGAVTVNVYRTTALNNEGAVKDKPEKTEHNTDPGTYELAAVYGGGNLAMYDPTNAETPAKVNIYGCGLTSIKQVYGGGNAAPVPSSEVMVEGTYEIYQVFGGGNGKDIIQKNGVWMENPGADVGIRSYTGSTPNLYGVNTSETSIIGVAKVSILGGTIHYVFGGSNTKGDVVKNSLLVLGSENIQACEYNVGKAYGGANDAPMSGDIVIEMGCTEGLDVIYGGARNADVNGNIVLNITGGHFNKVFGGNDNGGAIQGSITVNIEERSCLPIEIGELYGGGENAPYSIYGYQTVDGNIVKENDRPKVLETGTRKYNDPQVNIISATRIGTIYGGGYGATATMVGNPHVNINMTQGTINGNYEYNSEISNDRYNESAEGYSYKDANGNKLVLTPTEGTASNYPKALQLGSVGTVFGGGNAAEVKGNTFVNIGTGEWLNRNGERVMKGTTSDISTPTLFTYDATEEKWTYIDDTDPVEIEGTPTPFRNAAPITGSVYGGGNLANVTGSTQVVICATEGTGGTYQKVTETANVTIAENVYGAGKGTADDVEKAFVSANTKIIMGGGTVKKSVYGGGELSQVGGDTDISILNGTIGTTNQGGETYGNIYGGGKGNTTNVRSGLIKGNTNITVSGGSILHNIYGGGAHGSVGTYIYNNETANAAINEYTTFDDESKPTTGVTQINITGGTIGTDGDNNGMIFGSSRGDIDNENTIYDNLAWVYDTHVNIGTVNDETDGPIIHGSLYGSGENGHTFNNASVTMNSGTVGNPNEFYAYRGNVYGGGCGTDKYYSDPNNLPEGHTLHDGKGDTYNRNAGIVKGDATVIINGGSVANNVYGAGSMGKVLGSTSVTINTDGVIGVDGAHDDGNVYGAARGELGLANDFGSVTNSSVTLTKGTVKGSLYGGGKAGPVNGAVTVTLNGGTVNHDVYGGGALAETNTVNSYEEITEGITVGENGTDVDDYYTRSGAGTEGDPYQYTLASGKAASGTTYYRRLNTTNVTLSGSIIEGNLYGGGLGRLAGTYVAEDPEVLAGTQEVGDTKSAIAADVHGPVTVTVEDGLANNVFGCNNINGSPQSTVIVNINGTAAPTANRPQPILNVYGGGNQADYNYKNESHPLQVNIAGGTMGYVFGGGLSADVAGSIEVNISGGTVLEDVYGGGALANTNTANWDATANNNEGDWVDQSTGTYYAEVKHLKIGESSVVGYYTRTGDGSNEHPYVYSNAPLTEGTAAANTTYCKRINILTVAATGTQYETTVNLTGGKVGNVYGGGLGEFGTGIKYTNQTDCDTYNATLTGHKATGETLSAPEAAAYNAKLSGAIASGTKLTADQATAVNTKLSTSYSAGDEISAAHAASYNATLSGHITEDETLDATKAAAYNAKLPGAKSIGDWQTHPADGDGNVKAMVYGDVTVNLGDPLYAESDDADATAFTADVEFISNAENVAKHGRLFGCNNKNGTPKGKVTVNVYRTKRTDGSNTHVKGEFEVQGVYGGGNLADYVPQTYDNSENKHVEYGQKSQVNIYGCKKTSINKVYGGGNAAYVPFTDVNINGAFEIGYAFGGGNGGDKVNYGDGWVTNPGANVPGYTNVMLRGGTIGQAFGGSDTKGTVGGTDVKQETDPKCPLHIVNLYGAGNGDEASSDGDINITVSACGEGSEIQNVFGGSYKANIKGSVTLNITSGIFTSVYGGNDRMGSIGGPITVNIEETDDCNKPIIIQNLYGGCYQTAYPGVGAKDKNGNDYKFGEITVNVKSATRIDKVFGGSENGPVNGNTTVNINMVEGSQSGHTGVAVPDYYVNEDARPSNITNIVSGGKAEVYGLVTNADVLEDPTKERSSVVGYFTLDNPYTLVGGTGTTAVEGTTYYERALGSTYYPIPSEDIEVGGSVTGYYTRQDYQQATGTAEEGVTYYNLVGGKYTAVPSSDITVGTTDVSSYYIKKTTYPEAEGTAASGVTYYRRNNIYNTVAVTAGETVVSSYYTKKAENAYTYTDATGLAVAGVTYYKSSVKGDITEGIGTIGDVYGGGNMGNVSGNTTVNIATETSVNMVSLSNASRTVLGAKITGDVFGGGNLADVLDNLEYQEDHPTANLGNTYVNICAKDNGSGVYEAVAEGASHVTIAGNVYGGGKGVDDSFFCDKGMVGRNNANTGNKNNEDALYNDRGTHVHIGNGKVGTLEDITVNGVPKSVLKSGTGNVYGGGKVGRVEYHSVVTVGLTPQTDVTSAPEILGNVFGGGMGVETHGYSALLRGHTNVTVQQNAKVRNSVYGGGEISTIGRFWIKNVNNKDKDTDNLLEGAGPVPADLPSGMPYKLRDGGKCTVNILGNAEIGPTTAMTMPTFAGNVFGAGKGFLPKVYDYSADDDAHRPKRTAVSGDDYFEDEDAYMVFIETQALVNETHVTINGNAFVKGSVYGGSENGRVLNDTHVNIAGGQIGWGKNAEGRHPTSVWATNYEPSTDLECPSWDYESPFATYDPFAVNVNGTYKYDYTGIYSVIKPEDQRENSDGGRPTGSDGHTFYGNVFGGGSGKDPYAPGRWHRKAGAVGGNTYVNITGGHILTSVYGGNEHTDVGTYAADNLTPRSGGKCTVNMVGGTLGVPRTLAQIAAHPVTCYLFGAGKGDQRIFFNTWTNVISTEVNISGNARIYGSTFGGGEDGHVMNNAETNIGGSVIIGATTYNHTGVKIGTWGTSYVDGNVFGGGRGFSGEALTAGTVGGNVEVNISNGTMLGSVYGGGRLASVGTYFTKPNDPLYGQFQEDVTEAVHYTQEEIDAAQEGDAAYGKTTSDIKTPAGSYGHITVNISGGTIGNASPVADSENSKAKYSGNVFGGSMGRITLLNGSINPVWPELAQVKSTSISISGESTNIKRNVYGGGEYGTVRENASISISNGTIVGNVFGGGYGSDDHTNTTPITVYWNNTNLRYAYTPMQWAGSVGGNTQVDISGGTLNKNVYGGGELASVGIINYQVDAKAAAKDANTKLTEDNMVYYHHDPDSVFVGIIKHAVDINGAGTTNEKIYGFGLSWPYEFTYVPCKPNTEDVGGKTTVNITGGTFVTTGDTNTGFVFGGGMGKVAFGATDDITQQRYIEAFCANVRETQVTIGSGASVRTVYGGADNGHVYEDANVIINGGNIVRSVFGGGKGEDTFTTTLWNPASEGNPKDASESVHSWTAGKVYGNTNVTMKSGSVGLFIFGGGNLGSVGKGNYAGGLDDYFTAGYGETLIDDESTPNNEGLLWSATTGFNPDAEITTSNKPTSMADYFLSSGKSTVNIFGGTVGPTVGEYATTSGIPNGSVFGGSRGQAAKSVNLSPRYRYMPDFFLGYVNKAIINIGGYRCTTIDGSYQVGDLLTEKEYSKTTGLTAANWEQIGPRIYGSIYGGGQDGHVRNSTEVKIFNGNISGQVSDNNGRSGNVFGAGSGIGTYTVGDNEYCNNSSGSVTCTTLVEVKGGSIANSVYGGGALASVGPRKTPDITFNEFNNTEHEYPRDNNKVHGSKSLTKVVIQGGSIGGSVYGAGRGPAFSFLTEAFTGISTANNATEDKYNPTKFATSIWTEVDVTGGTIAGNVYGGGEMGQVKESTVVKLTGGTINNDAYGGGKGTKDAKNPSWDIAADIGGNTTVELNNNNEGGDADGEQEGCSVKQIFGCNDLNGTPKGHVLVHVYATQHPNRTVNPKIENKYAKYGNVTTYTATSHAELATLAEAVGMTDDQIEVYEGAIESADTDDGKTDALNNFREAISLSKYDVLAVYGGGNLAPYEPTDATLENSEPNKAKIDAARTEVIIDGCELTSIKRVYGGGNAASTPATHILINEAYEIDEVFGGGNGKDMYSMKEGTPSEDVWYQNPGANVGYHDFTEKGNESGADKEHAISQNDKSDALTLEGRANYGYGSGVANTEVRGGRIHMAYGGSNNRGNISKVAMSVYQESGTCELNVDKTYGAGKDAATDAQVIVNMDCVTNMDQLFGGSTNADVNNDIYLKVTNGTYNQVFGGNDTNGAINGSITVVIEESGCTPIKIKELYAGGYLAPYSIYGYKKNGNEYDRDENEHLIPLEAGDVGALDDEHKKLNPHINVISATMIGDIYGGGYKADVVGSPHINVNMTEGYINLKKVEVTKAEVTRRAKEGADNTTLVDASNNVYVIGSDYYDPANVFEEIIEEISHYYVYKDDNKNSYNSANVFTESGTKYVYASGAKESYANTGVQPKNTVAVTKDSKSPSDDETYAFQENGQWYVYKDEAGNLYLPSTVVTENNQTYAILNYYIPLSLGYIGNIFGGGNEADIIGSSYIDIGTGKWIKRTRGANGTVSETDEQNEVIVETLTRNKADILVDHNGESKPYFGNFVDGGGFVFGGGNQGDVTGNTYITVGDGATVENRIYGGGNLGDIGTIIKNTTDYNYKWGDDENEYNNTGVTNVTINGGTVGLATPTEAAPGNVFGGGKGDESSFYCEKGMVYGTNINITNGTVKGAVYGGGEIGRVENNTAVTIGTGDGVDPTGSDPQTSTPTIEGDVFGGGKGLKTHGYSALVRGNPTVTVQGNAKLMKSVYGGGEIASVGNFFVKGVPYLNAPEPPADIPNGMPYALKVANSGTCTVTVKGYAEIGPDNMAMTKAGGPDDTGYIFGAGKGILPGDYTYADKTHKPTRMAAYNAAVYTGDPGTSWEYASETDHKNVWEYFGNETAYLTFIETLAMTGATYVTVGGNAFVKGSVYGGSENGHVLNDTKVKIEDDCQIGNGYVQMDEDGNYLAEPYSLNRRYTAIEWAEGRLHKDGETNYQHSLPECASWPYGKNTGTEDAPVMKYLAYDVYDLDNNVPKHASDGHTFYGNVFGGGSGYFPYRRRSANKVPGETAWTRDPTKSATVGQSVDADGYSDGVWLRSAGAVFGNTTVEITGGHILTSVYGGNEMTDVGKFKYDSHNNAPTIPNIGGISKVTMSGGTLGVPRTLGQIAAHPVTCYLFGAGKGDQRINFNTWTNVNQVEVEITDDARIYGSVFGGGEDGHVLGNVKLYIKDGTTIGTGTDAIKYPLIGTTGTSYVDGNIFGGGRGFSGEALTAGSVGGNITVNISDGTMLGSVYGGGRLASVGTRFIAADDPFYGQLQPDADEDIHYTQDECDTYNKENNLTEGNDGYRTTSDVKIYAGSHGHITVNISGGTIGNDIEDITYDHPKGGNVFGGSMGRLFLLDNKTMIPFWPKMAVVKTSKINISGDALIKGNVYGGGELGMVRGDTHVTIGGVLGDDNETITSTESDHPTIKRDVFGGGYGSDRHDISATISAGGYSNDEYTFTAMQFAGIVCGDAYVNIQKGSVEKNVYGGGEMATVGLIDFTHAEQHNDIVNPGASNEKIYGFGLSWPYKMDFIPYDDTGESGHIGGTTYVNINGGRLGITGKDFMGPFNAAGKPLDVTNNNAVLDPDNNAADKKKYKAAKKDNGDVFGAGKGIAGSRYDYAFCANVKNTVVNINIPGDVVNPKNYKDLDLKYDCITGSVYAGGENGHVIENTELTLKKGLVGHSVYGGGKGKDTYHKTGLTRLDGGGSYDDDIYSISAGKVYGNTKVKIEGGYVVRNVYGGGNMASVGKGNYAGGADDYSTNGYGETLYKDEEHKENLWTTSYDPKDENSSKDYAWYFLNSGKTEVEVTGGTIGYVDSSKPSESMKDGLPYGNVFGGCRGEAAPNITESPRYIYCPLFYSGYVNETNVTIGTKDDVTGPSILGSVYGGGQDGHVRRDTHVTVYSGEIGLPFTDETEETWRTLFGKTSTTTLKDELDNPQWLYRGNVYGAGSGISKYKYNFDYDEGTYTDSNDNGDYDEGEPIDVSEYHGNSINEVDYSTSAGSVTRFTLVDINGGTIHRNVYGGGSMASVGAPKIPVNGVLPPDPYRKGDTAADHGVGKQSLNQVNIAGTIGTPTGYNEVYGGEVYGASRGIDANNTSLATSVWTEVNLLPGAYVQGNVFGGGDNGMVKKDADVNVGMPWTATIEAGNIPLTSGSKTITLTTKDKWTASSSDEGVEVSPSSGEGNGTITVTAEGYASARTITVTITGTGRSQTFTITQE